MSSDRRGNPCDIWLERATVEKTPPRNLFSSILSDGLLFL